MFGILRKQIFYPQIDADYRRLWASLLFLAGMGRIFSCSFLKKRTKKLLNHLASALCNLCVAFHACLNLR